MMILRTLAIGAALAFALFALPALSDEQPRLKAHVTVHGPLVTLGDLIEGAGLAASVAVFRAPDLGTAGTVRADRIVAEAVAHGITGLDTNGISSVSVSRTGREIGADEIKATIAGQLVASGRGDSVADIDVTLDRFDDPFVIEQSATAPLTIDQLEYDPGSGRFSAMLKVADSNTAGGGLRITGHAVDIVEVPVLARPIERGDIINASDIVINRVPRRTLRPEIVTNAARLSGLSARRHLAEGQPLNENDLMEPILVQRGDLVTIVYRTPGLTLTTRGRATSAGARGDVIQVFNIQSKRTVEAEISGPGFVTVMPQRIPFAALQTATIR
jgi:flagellar basal body P-ring formation protein FlgA